MSLELVLGIHVVADAVSEGVVDGVPLVDHGGGALVEQGLDLVAHVPGGGALRLGLLDVVVGEAGPGLGDGAAVSGRGKGSDRGDGDDEERF